jgi:ferrochelatase
MESAIAKLKAQHCDRILVFPLYPQYAASSTASAMDAVFRVLLKTRNQPAIRSIRNYNDHPAYIAALATSVREHWQANCKPNKLVISFHGVPKVHLTSGDPYHCQCHKTGRLLAKAPYLANTLTALGQAKTKRIDVICPGFSSDCLETLEEIAIEGKHIFQSNGGGDYHYIPALNENEAWIHAMTSIALENLQGWVTADWNSVEAKKEAEMTQLRAQTMSEIKHQ